MRFQLKEKFKKKVKNWLTEVRSRIEKRDKLKKENISATIEFGIYIKLLTHYAQTLGIVITFSLPPLF
jgi:hypothetical protein